MTEDLKIHVRDMMQRLQRAREELDDIEDEVRGISAGDLEHTPKNTLLRSIITAQDGVTKAERQLRMWFQQLRKM